MICKRSMLGASTFIYTGETWSSAGLLGVLNPVHSVGVLCLGLFKWISSELEGMNHNHSNATPIH